jgi:hypothetical protein
MKIGSLDLKEVLELLLILKIFLAFHQHEDKCVTRTSEETKYVKK